jgi:hypothetical protein
MIDHNQIIELAKEIESQDPINWDGLPLHRDAIYTMLGLSVLEKVSTYAQSERELILMAGVLKLTVENFVLQIRLGDFTK